MPVDPKQGHGRFSLSTEELWTDYHLRLKTVCLVNALAILFVYGLTYIVHLPSLHGRPFSVANLILGGAAILIVGSWVLNEYHYRRRIFSPKNHVYFIGGMLYFGDMVGITILIHFTGGVESPFQLLYVPLAMLGSFIGPKHRVLMFLASLGAAMHGGLLWLGHSGILPPHPSGLFTLSANISRYNAAVSLFVLTTTLTFLFLFIGQRLYRLYESQRLQLSEARANLEKLVEERTRDLNGTLEELRSTYDNLDSEKMKQERFFAHVTHQFRTPIHIINSFVSNFLNGVYGSVTGSQVEALHHLSMSAQNLLNLINNLLDMAKIHSGKMEFRAEAFSLREELEKIIGVMQPLAETRGVPIQWEVGSEVIDRMETDRVKLGAILTNLLHNAVKFSKDSPVQVRVFRSEDEADLVFQVRDFGKGIPLEHQEKIFEAFEQIHPSPEFRGSGLGLHISSTFARMMGGELRVRSEPGKGSTFEFRLREGKLGAGIRSGETKGVQGP